MTKEEKRIYNKTYNKKYRLLHLKEYEEYLEKYRPLHRIEIKNNRKEYRQLNLEKEKSYNKNWNESHKDMLKLRRKTRRKEWMVIIKSLGMDHCWKCNYDKCFAAIDFHHPNPKEKEMNIGTFLTKIITSKRIAELKKTTPWCSNCHREFHYNERRNKEEKDS